jgi:hypothetical protein
MKKSKVWNDKHYKRMQTIFESQGIKANFVFESPINSEAVLPEDQSRVEWEREMALLKEPSTDVQKKTQPASPWSPNPNKKRPGGEDPAPDWGAGDLKDAGVDLKKVIEDFEEEMRNPGNRVPGEEGFVPYREQFIDFIKGHPGAIDYTADALAMYDDYQKELNNKT